LKRRKNSRNRKTLTNRNAQTSRKQGFKTEQANKKLAIKITIGVAIAVIAGIILFVILPKKEPVQVNNDGGVVMGDGNTVGDINIIERNRSGYIDNSGVIIDGDGNIIMGGVNIENHFHENPSLSREERIENYLIIMNEVANSFVCTHPDCITEKGFSVQFDDNSTITHTLRYNDDFTRNLCYSMEYVGFRFRPRGVEYMSQKYDDDRQELYILLVGGGHDVAFRIGCTAIYSTIDEFIENRIRQYTRILPQDIRLEFEAIDNASANQIIDTRSLITV
jgi:hypothetical protein